MDGGGGVGLTFVMGFMGFCKVKCIWGIWYFMSKMVADIDSKHHTNCMKNTQTLNAKTKCLW